MASAPYIPAQSGRLRLKDAARPGPIGARVYGALAKRVLPCFTREHRRRHLDEPIVARELLAHARFILSRGQKYQICLMRRKALACQRSTQG